MKGRKKGERERITHVQTTHAPTIIDIEIRQPLGMDLTASVADDSTGTSASESGDEAGRGAESDGLERDGDGDLPSTAESSVHKKQAVRVISTRQEKILYFACCYLHPKSQFETRGRVEILAQFDAAVHHGKGKKKGRHAAGEAEPRGQAQGTTEPPWVDLDMPPPEAIKASKESHASYCRDLEQSRQSWNRFLPWGGESEGDGKGPIGARHLPLENEAFASYTDVLSSVLETSEESALECTGEALISATVSACAFPRLSTDGSPSVNGLVHTMWALKRGKKRMLFFVLATASLESVRKGIPGMLPRLAIPFLDDLERTFCARHSDAIVEDICEGGRPGRIITGRLQQSTLVSLQEMVLRWKTQSNVCLDDWEHAPKVEALRLAENAAKANKHCDPVYPEHVAGANDGSCFSDTDTYKEIIAMERENTILCAKLDKLIEEGDGFDV